MVVIRNFVYDICSCEPDWTTNLFIDEAVSQVQQQVGDKKVLLPNLCDIKYWARFFTFDLDFFTWL